MIMVILVKIIYCKWKIPIQSSSKKEREILVHVTEKDRGEVISGKNGSGVQMTTSTLSPPPQHLALPSQWDTLIYSYYLCGYGFP